MQTFSKTLFRLCLPLEAHVEKNQTSKWKLSIVARSAHKNRMEAERKSSVHCASSNFVHCRRIQYNH